MTWNAGEVAGPAPDDREAELVRQLVALRRDAYAVAELVLTHMEPGNPPLVGASGTRYWAVRGQAVPRGAAGPRDRRLLVAQRGHQLVVLNAPADRTLLDTDLATMTCAGTDVQLSAARTFLEDAPEVVERAGRLSHESDLAGRRLTVEASDGDHA